MILAIFFTKMAITHPIKVQITKFWCLKSCIWLSCGDIYSIKKNNKIELEDKKGLKLAKIAQFFALKKLKLHFLKNFLRFDLKTFLCVFLYVGTNFSHWQNLCDTPDLVGCLHRHCVLDHVLVLAVNLVHFMVWMGRGDHSNTLSLSLFCWSTPSWLKVGGGVVG